MMLSCYKLSQKGREKGKKRKRKMEEKGSNIIQLKNKQNPKIIIN